MAPADRFCLGASVTRDCRTGADGAASFTTRIVAALIPDAASAFGATGTAAAIDAATMAAAIELIISSLHQSMRNRAALQLTSFLISWT
jgi:hypothetical protein